MSPLATATMVSGSVCVFVCFYACLLHAWRREEREYLCFGLLAGAWATFSFGGALVIDARTTVQSAGAMSIQIAGGCAAMAFLVDFCHELAGRRTVLQLAAYLWAGAGAFCAFLGLFTDPFFAAPTATWGFSGAPDYYEARLTPYAYVWSIVLWGLGAYALLLLFRQVSNRAEVRLLLGAALVNAAAAVHDTLIQLGSLRSSYMLAYTGTLTVVALSYVLLDRYVRTTEELGQRTRELRESYHAARETQLHLVRKEQLVAVGELSAVIAHEVRNPLAIIKNAVSGLRRPTLREDDRRTLLGILGEEVDRLSRVVQDLLTYASPVATLEGPLRIIELIEQSVELARAANDEATAVEFKQRVEQPLQTLFGAPQLLQHAFVNIVDNAIHAMPNGGSIEVSVSNTTLEQRPAVCIEFRDTGEGMDEEVCSKARDPFFTTRPSGTGLGLAIVDRVVRAHGGILRIESRVGHGTTVSLTLPEESRPTDHAPPALRAGVEGTAVPSGSD